MRLILALTAVFALVACADTSEIDNAPKASVQEPVKDAAPAAVKKEAPAQSGAMVVMPLDANQSTIGFLGAKVTGTHDGGFKAFSGSVQWMGDAPKGLAVSVDMTSLFADKEKLTGHLKSGDFFDVENKPSAMFKGSSFEKIPDGTWTVGGEMTIMGTTKAISFPATIEKTEAGVNATAEFQINRQDFGIVYPGKPDDLIKDEVALKIALVFPKRG
jgi:polyisoprenoid-binding protein YceI